MKFSEFLHVSTVNAQAAFNGRRLDWARGGLIDEKGGFSPLRPQSFRVLDYLASHMGEIVAKDDIFAEVWPGTAVTDDSLTQCIADIRRALDDSDRRVLETVPRVGFRLHPDASRPRRILIRGRRAAMLGLAVFVLMAVAVLGTRVIIWNGSQQREDLATLALIQGTGAEAFAAEVASELDRYPAIRRVSGDARFNLVLSQPSPHRLLAELTDTQTLDIILTEAIEASDEADVLASRARVLSNTVATPYANGAIAQVLFDDARDKPLARLTNGECYLHYYIQHGADALSLSTFARSKACLERIVARDPENPTALALLGATLAEQYWYGTGLDDQRDIPELRRPLAKKALEYARSAEASVLPPDADVHSAVARIYYANCKTDLLVAKAHRTLGFRPDDPVLLGTFGNWIAYAGNWETGVSMAQRAIDIVQQNSARWWYWAMGKDAWNKGDYQAALDAFMQGYEENSWHNELHLAYTLPFLDR